MPQNIASRIGFVQFADGFEIMKTDLDRAIGGGMKRAGLSKSPPQQREEIYAIVYLKLARFFHKNKTPTGAICSLAWKMAYYTAVDTIRRPDEYEEGRSYGIEVSDARPAVELDMAALNGEDVYLALETATHRNQKLGRAIRTLSDKDQNALIDALDRTVALKRTTPEAIRIANLVSQREKRAKDRLIEAYRAGDREK
jgi:hypothetical protein